MFRYKHACWSQITDWYSRDQNIVIYSYYMRVYPWYGMELWRMMSGRVVTLCYQARKPTIKTRDGITKMVGTKNNCMPKEAHVSENIYAQKFKFWCPCFSAFTSRCDSELNRFKHRQPPRFVALLKSSLFYIFSFSLLPTLDFVPLSTSIHYF